MSLLSAFTEKQLNERNNPGERWGLAYSVARGGANN